MIAYPIAILFSLSDSPPWSGEPITKEPLVHRLMLFSPGSSVFTFYTAIIQHYERVKMIEVEDNIYSRPGFLPSHQEWPIKTFRRTVGKINIKPEEVSNKRPTKYGDTHMHLLTVTTSRSDPIGYVDMTYMLVRIAGWTTSCYGLVEISSVITPQSMQVDLWSFAFCQP